MPFFLEELTSKESLNFFFVILHIKLKK